MKISLKIPAIATLGVLVMCAGVLSASANGAANQSNAENRYTVGDYYVSGAYHPIYEKYKNYGLHEGQCFSVGEEPEYLTDYPEELLPYVEELERINAELGTDCEFSIEVSEVEEAIDFHTSMTIEEFRDYIYGAYENDIAHPLPFDKYIAETEQSEECLVGVIGGFAESSECDDDYIDRSTKYYSVGTNEPFTETHYYVEITPTSGRLSHEDGIINR